MDREKCLFEAQVAEQTERYEEMKVAMRRLVELDAQLSSDERNLLSVAFKNVIGTRRQSWRAITALESKEGKDSQQKLIKAYRAQIEKELASICNEILTLLKDHLIPQAQSDEAKVFFLKMKGDYHRYFAETASGEEQRDLALAAYQQATTHAQSLAPTHPVRLGLALNFSVFHYEIRKDCELGCKLAKEAFDSAVTDIDQLDEDMYKESTLILQLLRDNLALWSEDRAAGDDAENAGKVDEF